MFIYSLNIGVDADLLDLEHGGQTKDAQRTIKTGDVTGNTAK